MSHHFRAPELGDLLIPVAFGPTMGTGEGIREPEFLGGHVGIGERDAGHRLHAAGHHQLARAAHHRLRRVADGLLARTALPFDGAAGNRLGQPRREPCVAGDVHGLRAQLVDAPQDHLVVLLGINALPGDQLLQRGGSQIERVNLSKSPAPAPHGGADGIDNVGLSHEQFSERSIEQGRMSSSGCQRGAMRRAPSMRSVVPLR